MAVPLPPHRRLYSERERRRRQAQFRRRRIGVLLAVAALIVIVVVAVDSLGGSSPHRPAGEGSPATTPSAGGTAVTGTTVAAAGTTTAPGTTRPPATRPTTTLPASTLPTTTGPDPGTLPQTGAFPTSSSPAFTDHMNALWNGIVADNPQLALGGFFPESAYEKVKAETDPAADFTTRLEAELAADVAAAHHLLGSDPSAATFVGVQVNEAYAHWVNPGTCANNLGYFEVPNARLVYAVAGQPRSFGIASMISWRGEWYVVHLGAVTRTGTAGVVDDPEAGPGTSAYLATC